MNILEYTWIKRMTISLIFQEKLQVMTKFNWADLYNSHQRRQIYQSHQNKIFIFYIFEKKHHFIFLIYVLVYLWTIQCKFKLCQQGMSLQILKL